MKIEVHIGCWTLGCLLAKAFGVERWTLPLLRISRRFGGSVSVSSTLQRILTIINENDDTPGKGKNCAALMLRLAVADFGPASRNLARRFYEVRAPKRAAGFTDEADWLNRRIKTIAAEN